MRQLVSRALSISLLASTVVVTQARRFAVDGAGTNNASPTRAKTLASICDTALQGLQRYASNPTGNALQDHLPANTSTLEAITSSIQKSCGHFDVGGASRSNSDFALTGDGHWVLKKIKPDEVDALWRLSGAGGTQGWIGGPPREFWTNSNCAASLRSNYPCKLRGSPEYEYKRRQLAGESLMVPFTFVDPQTQVVVMPNFKAAAKEAFASIIPPHIAMSKFDVKPMQVRNSEERGDMFVQLLKLGWAPSDDETLLCTIRGQKLSGHQCWLDLKNMLRDDVMFLTYGREWSFIDFSLVFEVATVEVASEPSNIHIPPNCVLSYREGSVKALCVHVIDFLMEYGWTRAFESWWKNGKFDGYGGAVRDLLDCAGEMTAPNCKQYLREACRLTDDILIGDQLSWCKTVPRATRGAFTKNSSWPDDDWRGMYPGSEHAITCHDLERTKCTADHASLLGFSSKLGRVVSALQACCCEGLGLRFGKTRNTWEDDFDQMLDAMP